MIIPVHSVLYVYMFTGEILGNIIYFQAISEGQEVVDTAIPGLAIYINS